MRDVKVHDLGHSKATLQVYGREHAPPHFHIVGPGFSVSIDMATLSVDGIRGRPPKNVVADAIAWASLVENQKLLQTTWDTLNERIH